VCACIVRNNFCVRCVFLNNLSLAGLTEINDSKCELSYVYTDQLPTLENLVRIESSASHSQSPLNDNSAVYFNKLKNSGIFT